MHCHIQKKRYPLQQGLSCFNMLCIWNPSQSKYIKHHFVFILFFSFLAMEKNSCKTFKSPLLLLFFFNGFPPLLTAYEVLKCWNVKGVRGRRRERGQEHTTEQINIITLHYYCIQYGSRKTKKPQMNFDMYNHLWMLI